MVLTKDFKETIHKRALKDEEFRNGLLTESIQAMLEGDLDTGKSLLRDYINATTGFEKLAKATDTEPKSLMRMVGPKGNPTTKNLFNVLHHLQKLAGIELRINT